MTKCAKCAELAPEMVPEMGAGNGCRKWGARNEWGAGNGVQEIVPPGNGAAGKFFKKCKQM